MDKIEIVEKFVTRMESNISEVKRLLSFLQVKDEQQKMILNEGIDILESKIRKAKKVQYVEDTDKYIKTNKIVKNYKGDD